MSVSACRRVGACRNSELRVVSKVPPRIVTLQKRVMSSAKDFRSLDVYRGAMALVMRIFELTEQFPGRERYVLTDQVRRSSRSVCANLAEVWRKRRYEGAFVSKLSDAEAEAAEAQVYIEIEYRLSYLNQEVFDELDDAYDKILGRIVKMINQADQWLVKGQWNASRE